MHELSLVLNILQVVEENINTYGLKKVHRIVVSVGDKTHVDGAALDFAFRAAASKSAAGDAVLEIRPESGSSDVVLMAVEGE